MKKRFGGREESKREERKEGKEGVKGKEKKMRVGHTLRASHFTRFAELSVLVGEKRKC